ncbi:hypothetical protein SsS58_08570 [Streptomyces scabiei]|uniref:Uncharacterized protein n=1 Tax=Streptomyces scabiei TaxID=1930 RepID=A0A100JYP7_STRSC|nr:hypothetical protein SsS58_08570 [Streptomyces scabiei]
MPVQGPYRREPDSMAMSQRGSRIRVIAVRTPLCVALWMLFPVFFEMK